MSRQTGPRSPSLSSQIPSAVSEIFIFGGDDYSFDRGGGGLLNDVWKTVGART